jgi:hypothetical protein
VAVRILLAALCFLAAGAFAAPAQADPYRWCADYGGGARGSATNCGFVTLEQCRATVSGAGGYCVPNPFYDGVPFDTQRPVKRVKRPRS